MDAPTPTIAVGLATFLLGAGQALQYYASHNKGKAGKQENEKTLKRIEHKLDEFIEAQRDVNHAHDKRLSSVSALVIGPDGENGLRGDVRELKADVKALRASA